MRIKRLVTFVIAFVLSAGIAAAVTGDYFNKEFGGPLRLMTDMGDTSHADRVIAHPPFDLLTDGGDGPNRRLRVDVAQIGFFAGREFRTFVEWETATTGTQVIKAVVPIDIILFELGVNIEEGTLRIETLVGGTEGGTFGDDLPIFPTNTMTEKPQPPYVNQVLLTTGGTLSGGTLLDPLRVKTSANSNFAGSVGAATGAERGVGPNTYYFRITLSGVIGTFKARWEERL